MVYSHSETNENPAKRIKGNISAKRLTLKPCNFKTSPMTPDFLSNFLTLLWMVCAMKNDILIDERSIQIKTVLKIWRRCELIWQRYYRKTKTTPDFFFLKSRVRAPKCRDVKWKHQPFWIIIENVWSVWISCKIWLNFPSYLGLIVVDLVE
jgi:hypothetical protein